ncbi:oligosaccharide flippase family protein [Paenibacillus sp. N3/727]|uniref:oligosaccharide flippase family protein n=1 Tax=Paenibacillus sp. N3/727 TaxID=2925845 RepID=UPI001F5394D3|nr:oligosaccharide flippase family protein [Paenibacillus sp. N3/727]UNK16205.1 oligosaccharide flippase family protein [Paenibacillus sp. N3/727]
MNNSHFIKQMAFRISAILMVKAIGLIGRVSLTRLIGAEGIGLFQIAYSYFGLGLMVLTGGLPTALAMFTARNSSHGWIWFKIISMYLILIGGCVSILSFYYSDNIAKFLGNDELYYFIRFLAPALFAVPLLSLLRGYLQGMELYNVIAVSEIIEQAVRVLLMMSIVFLLLDRGPVFAAGKSMLGTSFGAISAFLVLISYYFYYVNRQSRISIRGTDINLQKDLKWFLHSSFIISLTRLLVPLSDVLDAIVIPNRLQIAGYSSIQATAFFGVLTGMAALVTYMPTLVTAALSHTLTMKMVTDWRERNYERFHRRTRRALELCWVWGCISSLFLYVYNTEISVSLFGTTEAAEPIRYLFIVPLLVGLREISTSILWVQEHKKAPLLGLVCGICIAVTVHYFLVAIPGLGYWGASAGILILEFVAVGWNLLVMLPVLKRLRYNRLIIDALVITLLMYLISQFTHTVESEIFTETILTVIGMIIYIGCSVLYIFFRFKTTK